MLSNSLVSKYVCLSLVCAGLLGLSVAPAAAQAAADPNPGNITLIGNDPSYSQIVAFSIEQSDGVTAVSNSLRESTYAELNVTRDIAVIPNFLDCAVHRRRIASGV